MNICICIPTRGRPEYLERLVESAYTTALDQSNVIVKYYLNEDDKKLKDYIDILTRLQKKYGSNIQYEIGPDCNTVLSWNMLAESTDADFYMLAGDEIQFMTEHWEQKIFNVKTKYPDGIFCISTNDGRENRVTLEKCVQPIVTKEWGKALGYYWSPMFWHWQVDFYTGELAKSIGRFIFLKKVLIKMKKIKDETGVRNRKPGIFLRDDYVFKKLMNLYFDVDKNRLLQFCK